MGIKLSAKFARQESEQARLARIARKRIPTDRIETIRRMMLIATVVALLVWRIGVFKLVIQTR